MNFLFKKTFYIKLFQQYKYILSSPILSTVTAIILFLCVNISSIIPTCLLILGITIPPIIILLREYRIKEKQLLAVKGLEREHHCVSRILNRRGDFQYHSRIKITNEDEYPLEYLQKETISSDGPSIHLSDPIVIESTYPDSKIIERYNYSYTKEVHLDQETISQNAVDFCLRISPPLRNKGDFIVYERTYKIDGHCSKAFTSEGSIDGFLIKKYNTLVSMTLIAPENFKVKIVEFWVEDYQGNRIPELLRKFQNNKPIYSSNDTEWEWSIRYPIMNHGYYYKFKLEPF